MPEKKYYDSILIITTDTNLQKGIALSLLPYFSNICAPSTIRQTKDLLITNKFDFVVMDFMSCCENDFELYKRVQSRTPAANHFILNFSEKDEIVKIIAENNIKTVVNSVNEILSIITENKKVVK